MKKNDNKKLLTKRELANTKLLLKNYRRIQLCVNSKELDYVEALQFYGVDDRDVVETFKNYENNEISKQKIIDMNNRLINYMAISLEALRQSSAKGEREYKLLYYKYLSMEEYSEKKIEKILKIPHSTLTYQKKKAIEHLGVIMWGIVGLNNEKLTELCEMFTEFLPELNCRNKQDELIEYQLEHYDVSSKKSVHSLEKYKELIEAKLEQAYIKQIKGELKKANGSKNEKKG